MRRWSQRLRLATGSPCTPCSRAITPGSRFVLRLIGNETVAEDVTSEAFLCVWQQADRFEARSTFATWLLAIARNKAMTELRHPRRIPGRGAGRSGRPDRRPGGGVCGQAPGCSPARLPRPALARAPRDHRSCLLSRKVGAGGGGNHGHSPQHRQNAHVLRAAEIVAAAGDAGRGAGGTVDISSLRQDGLGLRGKKGPSHCRT